MLKNIPKLDALFFVHFKKVLFYLLAFFEQSTKKRIKDAKLTIIII